MSMIYVGKKSGVTNYVHRTDAYNAYIRMISKYHVLTPDEENDLIIDYKENGNKESRDKVILHNQRFVLSVVKQYADNKNDDILDLINEANIGLCEAIDVFDTTLGFKFISFAIWYIRKYVKAYFDKKHVVNSHKYNSIANTINTISELYYQKNGFYPSNEYIESELRENYGKSFIINDCDKMSPISMSIDKCIDDGDDQLFGDSSIFNNATSSDNMCISMFNDLHNKEVVNELLEQLQPLNQLIITLKYGLNGNKALTTKEISELIKLPITYINKKHRKSIEIMASKINELKIAI